MRPVAALLLLSLARCSAPSYTVRAAPAATLIASRDAAGTESPSLAERAAAVRRGHALSSPALVVAAAAPATERPIELVPSVQRGHSTRWKTGAIITFTSIGVSLAGAGMTLLGLGNLEQSSGTSSLFILGFATSIIGDAGMAIVGPAVWLSAIGKRPE